MVGKKNDNDKLRMDLIPPAALAAMADTLTMGANKYGAHNWREGIVYSRIIAAVLRHIQAWQSGEDRDPEDGQLHLGSALTGLAMLCEYEAGPDRGLDDRFPGVTAAEIRRWVKRKDTTIIRNVTF